MVIIATAAEKAAMVWPSEMGTATATICSLVSDLRFTDSQAGARSKVSHLQGAELR
jgi:hypothetical protein